MGANNEGDTVWRIADFDSWSEVRVAVDMGYFCGVDSKFSSWNGSGMKKKGEVGAWFGVVDQVEYAIKKGMVKKERRGRW